MYSGLPGILSTPPYNVAFYSLSKLLLSVYIMFYSYMEIKLILILILILKVLYKYNLSYIFYLIIS